MKSNPKIKAAKAVSKTRASCHRVLRRLKGIPPSSSRGGHNKKLAEPENYALREHLLMCYSMGKSAAVDNVIASANSILRCLGLDATVSQR
jgi:hypothetical protein